MNCTDSIMAAVMSHYDRRLETFVTYPKQIVPNKNELAHAGFYYSGTADKVICFRCGISLKDWEREDNAMIEHEKWSPNCMYIQMVGIPLKEMDVIG